jgi:hypothetical protein
MVRRETGLAVSRASNPMIVGPRVNSGPVPTKQELPLPHFGIALSATASLSD